MSNTEGVLRAHVDQSAQGGWSVSLEDADGVVRPPIAEGLEFDAAMTAAESESLDVVVRRYLHHRGCGTIKKITGSGTAVVERVLICTRTFAHDDPVHEDMSGVQWSDEVSADQKEEKE